MGITFYERQIIELRLRVRWSIRRIARYLKRDHSVVVREIKRNSCLNGKYLANHAQFKADKLTHKTNVRLLNNNPHLRRHVIRSIRDDQLSPEQIAGRLKTVPPLELKGVTISHESIYQWIYTEQKWLYKYLRRKKRASRQKHFSRKTRIKNTIPERISIHERPQIIDEKIRLGDWESDSMKFSKQKTALSVQYERMSMLARITKVDNLGKDETHRALTQSVDSLPQYLWNSITFDNGGEAARHTELRTDYNIGTYFCDAYASWQKGGVENLNGLIC
ncbi:MAG: IS30 family transposase [Candidatus Magasanikbacteria bacterium]|nr:IS30 family transposase [Candidatus Magasanikbacteria bacterium]